MENRARLALIGAVAGAAFVLLQDVGALADKQPLEIVGMALGGAAAGAAAFLIVVWARRMMRGE